MKKSITKHVHDANVESLDVGDKCNSVREGKKIFNILQTVLFQRLRFVVSSPMAQLSNYNLVWFGVSFDGWKRSMFFFFFFNLFIKCFCKQI